MRALLNVARRRIVPDAVRPWIEPLIVVRSEPDLLRNAPLKPLPLSLINENFACATNPVWFEQFNRVWNANDRTWVPLTRNDTARLSDVRPT